MKWVACHETTTEENAYLGHKQKSLYEKKGSIGLTFLLE